MPRLLITYYKLTFVYRVYSSLWGEYTLSEPGPYPVTKLSAKET